jgi:hypothetical protein
MRICMDVRSVPFEATEPMMNTESVAIGYNVRFVKSGFVQCRHSAECCGSSCYPKEAKACSSEQQVNEFIVIFSVLV